MTELSTNVYINRLDEITVKYNKTYNKTIKMKSADVKVGTYSDYDDQHNTKDPKFNVGDHVRTQKYKNMFTKGYTPNGPEEVFAITKVKKILYLEHTLSVIEKEMQKTSQTEFRVEKAIKKKCDRV